MIDEAIYAQVAKESLLNNSFLTLHWQGQPWFEKPPLIIWLITLSFKLFGISETSARLFPGLFGAFSALTLYAIGKELFKNKLAGFLTGFVFLTTPIILLYDRTAMLDIPIGFFISLCALAILKLNTSEKNWWWLVYFSALSLGVLTKSVIGLLPLALLLFYLIYQQNSAFLKNKYFQAGIVLFFLLTLPWHLYLSLKFGLTFWNEYLGFHIWKRFSTQIFQYPWADATNFGYLKLLALRSGLWFWLASLFCMKIIFTILFQKNIKRSAKKSFLNLVYFSNWIEKQTTAWLFLFFWLILCLAPFFVAWTKIPSYMLLAFFPLAVFVGGFLEFLFRKNLPALLLCLFSLLNFFPVIRLHASDFGEAHFLLPKILIRFFNFSDIALIWSAFFLLIILTSFYLLAKNSQSALFKKIALTFFLSTTMLVPFNPARNDQIKQIGQDITKISNNQAVTL